MSSKRPRTERREQERKQRDLVRAKEKLFALSIGGSRERPYEVKSTSVIETRVEQLPCVQCDVAQYRIREHERLDDIRRLDCICRNCGAPRVFWFKLVVDEPN
ncbi:MAG TPA: hypothetical protein VGM39_05135 [Kofleriaceae bacterium]|jgi:hypothetical protein